jgi:hypothetical protein
MYFEMEFKVKIDFGKRYRFSYKINKKEESVKTNNDPWNSAKLWINEEKNHYTVKQTRELTKCNLLFHLLHKSLNVFLSFRKIIIRFIYH